jgi:hypothetical protein
MEPEYRIPERPRLRPVLIDVPHVVAIRPARFKIFDMAIGK